MQNGDKVYVVHRDVAYELGEVRGVFITLAEAEACIDDAVNEGPCNSDRDDYSIQEWLLGERL